MISDSLWPYFRKCGLKPASAWLASRCLAPFLFAVLIMHFLKWTRLSWSGSIFWLILAPVLASGIFIFIRQRRLHRRELMAILRLEIILFIFTALLSILFGFYFRGATQGERPLDLGLLSSLWSSQGIPPVDFWFVGRTLNTYYLGQWTYAVMGRSFGIEPCGLYIPALAILWGQVLAISFLASRIFKNRTLFSFLPFLLIMIPNASFLYKWIEGISAASPHALVHYTRIIPHTINENPQLAFWVSELHAHVMALPLLMAYCLFLHYAIEKRKTAFFIITGVTGALLAMTDSWLVIPSAVFTFIYVISRGKRAVYPMLKGIPPLLVSGTVTGLAFLADFKGYPFRLLFVKTNFTSALHILTLFGPLFLIYITVLLIKRRSCVLRRISLGFLLSAVVIIIFCEIFYVDNQFPPPGERQNTVFRFHYAAYVFLALGICVLWREFQERRIRISLLSFIAVLYIFGSIIPGAARSFHDGWRRNLDICECMEMESPEIVQTGRWLFMKTPPDTVIAESAGPPYRGFSTASSISGRTALLGEIDKVRNHGVPVSEINQRYEELFRIYLDLPEAPEILKKYNVDYIILGPAEKRAFKAIREDALLRRYQEVYKFGNTRILEVK